MHYCFGVDIGNSGIRVAELDIIEHDIGRLLRIDWRHDVANSTASRTFPVPRYLPSDPTWTRELEQFLSEVCGLGGAVRSPDTRWLVSSVRGDAWEVLQEYLQGRNYTCVQLVAHTQLPIAVNVLQPERVGIDRLLAAYAASELTDTRPFVVIQAGSAVTVDLVNVGPAATDAAMADSEDEMSTCFEGGAILPGVPMMLRLLGKAAYQLPELEADDLLELPKLPGKNTEQAMLCGAASALVGGVCHLVERYRTTYGRNLPVILSGGDGMRLSPYLAEPVIVKSHLVQRGLLRLAEIKDRKPPAS